MTLRGPGPPVILLHPVGLDGGVWEPLATQLADGRMVMCPSLRGHGDAVVAVPPWTVADLAADVHEEIERARAGAADVVGLSLGGMVAQQLALDFPRDVRSLVLLNTTAGFDANVREGIRQRGQRALEGGMATVVEETLERWCAPAARSGELAARIRQLLLNRDPRSWAASWDAMADFDARPRLGQLGIPVLVIAAGDDRSTPPSVSSELVEALPRARLRIIRGASHLGPLEEPGRYRSLIGAFWADQPRLRQLPEP